MSRPSNLQLNHTNIQQDSMPPVPQRNSPNVMSRPFERSGNRGSFPEAQSLDYYYGRIPNKQVEELLRPHMDYRGSFLLRDSNTEHGVITISVVDNPRHIYHFKVNHTKGLYEVTANLIFRSLCHLVEFFGINEVPGTNQLKLSTPIRIRHSPKTPPRSPKVVQLDKIPNRPPPRDKVKSQLVGQAAMNCNNFLDFRAPLPTPKPGTEPIYVDHDHVYCRAEDLKKSRIDEIMELCKISDEKYKKCTCGLYMEQSILVDNWMMHIDRPEGDHVATNRVFFVNTVTNQTLWELPESTMHMLAQQSPKKTEFLLKLLQEGGNL